ncbi:MAG: diphosphate--fructose-6-phosphate 1-phosphotransferase [Spirochaetes bacterium]|nr:diphosphate--fructose-6-phosphate 1-phosphotransferase [Spirochaetota bacterium]
MKPNLIIGQSGGPTPVINSTLCGVIQEALKSDHFANILGMMYGIEGFLQDKVINLGKESSKTIEQLKFTPSSALGSCRYKLCDSDFPVLLEKFKKLDIQFFLLIGGNDTMDTIHRLEKYCHENGYPLIGLGLPKTVDNDLFGTDFTPGYPSAARYTALSIQQSGRLACDMQKVDKFVIHQTVGREAGWLAASSALAKKQEWEAPHLIYVPESRLNQDQFLTDVKNCISEYGWVSIVCGEGILFEDGTPVSAAQSKDQFSNVEFGAMGGNSAALSLHRLVSAETGYRGEFQITESLSMCAIDRVSQLDQDIAYQCGAQAVKLALENTSGVMVSIKRMNHQPYQYELTTIPLENVAIKAKPMDKKYINKAGNFVTNEFIQYIKPLVGPLGEYAVLDKYDFM